MRLQLIKANAVVIFAAAALACGSSPTNNPVAPGNANATPVAASSPTAERSATNTGKSLYTVNCMTCHKDSGKGGKVTVDGKNLDPDDLTTARMKAKSDEKLYGYVADGIVDEGMPAFKDQLKPDEIRAIVAHMRNLQNGTDSSILQ